MRNQQKGALARVLSAAILLSSLLVAMVATASPAGAAEPAAYRAIAAGNDHQCFVVNGEVWCAGENSEGQTGQDPKATRDVLTPTKVPGLSGVVSVTAGEKHTCALLSNGTARCWGKNNKAQLGNGTRVDSHVPVVVSGIGNFTYLDAADRHTCGVRTDGTIVCWGDNERGQLGNGATGISTTPSTVQGIRNAVTVNGGQDHTCAVVATGAIQCWGNNNNGELGEGGNPFTDSLIPRFVQGINKVSSVASGWDHTCAVTTGGSVYCWGSNDEGQVGSGNLGQKYNRPRKVPGISNAVQVAAGLRFSCAVTSDGSAYCWGDNWRGNIGNGQGGQGTIQQTPFQTGLSGVTAITAGDLHTCALTADGPYCWGKNNHGQLGLGNLNDVRTPTGVALAGRPAPGAPNPPAPPTPEPGTTLEELVAQPEFSAADADTLRLYNAFFLRQPDDSGANYWVNLTRQGTDLSVIAFQFAVSTEFQNRYGTLSNEQYVATIYTNVLGRNFDQSGYNYWLGLLNDGTLDRGGVVRWIAANNEFKNDNLYAGK